MRWSTGSPSTSSGGRTALPIFREVMLRVYERQLAGPVPQFPREIEHRIDQYLMRRAALGRACLDDGTPGSSVNLIQKENEP